MGSEHLHEVAITAVVIKDGKYLITRRAKSKKRFPGMWTVPGGKLETSDYLSIPKQTKDYWYNVLERTLEREVREEVGLEIRRVEYLTSLATIHKDGYPSLVISCVAEYASGSVTLDPTESDAFAWVTTEEAKKYNLIDGFIEEFVMIDKKRSGQAAEWQRLDSQSALI